MNCLCNKNLVILAHLFFFSKLIAGPISYPKDINWLFCVDEYFIFSYWMVAFKSTVKWDAYPFGGLWIQPQPYIISIEKCTMNRKWFNFINNTNILSPHTNFHIRNTLTDVHTYMLLSKVTHGENQSRLIGALRWIGCVDWFLLIPQYQNFCVVG